MEKEILDLQQAGANARAVGRPWLDNPYYKSEAMPGHTGEPFEEWNRKVKAWKFGWDMEDVMRA